MKHVFDVEWRKRALCGDGAAIQALADFALGPLYRFCLYRVGGDRNICEEIVQETLLVAIRRLDRYEPQRTAGDIVGWLTGLARNEIRRALNAQRGVKNATSLWDRIDAELFEVYARLPSAPLTDDILEREETRDMVNATMSQLPTHHREPLEERYFRGKSVREIAQLFTITEKAAESRLGRARQAFRETFLSLTKHLSAEPG